MKLYRCVYQMGVETSLEYRANMVLTLLFILQPSLSEDMELPSVVLS